MKMDLEIELHNAGSSSSAANRKRKKRSKKSNVLCNSNDFCHDCPEGASLMKDIPLIENSCAESIVDKSGLIEAQSKSDLVCSERKKKRKRHRKQKTNNALTTDNTKSAVEISSNSSLTEAQNNSSLMRSKIRKKRKKQQMEKKHIAPITDNIDADLQEVTSKMTTVTTESTVDVSSNSGLIKAHNNFNSMCSKSKKKRKMLQLKKKCDGTKTDNRDTDLEEVTSKSTTAPLETVALVDMITKAVSVTSSLEVEALSDTSTKIEMNALVDTSTMIHSARNLSRLQRNRLRKKLRRQRVHILEHDVKDFAFTGDKSLIKNMLPDKDSSLHPSVDISKNELVMRQPYGDACLFSGSNASENDRVVNLQMENDMNLEKEDTKRMELAAAPIVMKASVDTSTTIHSTQHLSRSQRKKWRKKLRKQGVHVLECNGSKDSVLVGDNSLSKIMFPVKHSSFQPSVDISKNELVVKQPYGDLCLFNGRNASENNRVVNLQRENDMNLEKVDMKKMDLPATPIDTKASVDTSTMIHSAQHLNRSQRKNLRKKLLKQGVHVLECDASKDSVLLGDNSPRKNMFPVKHSSFQPSVDLCSNSGLVVKQSYGDVCLFNGQNDRVVNLQKENDMHLEKEDMEKMDLAAVPISMKASVDTSTTTHSAQNLSRLQRKKLRKKLRKQGVHVLECDGSKDSVLLGDNSLSKNVFPVNHSSFQPSVDLCSKTELVVKLSNEDVCLFNGHNSSEDNRVVDLQMAKGKHLENKEAQPVLKAAELDLTTMREDFPLSEKQSSSSISANRSLVEKNDFHAKSYPTLSETRNIVTYKRKKIFKTNISEKRKKCSDSLTNSLDCIKEDGDSLMKNMSVLPQVQFEQKGKGKLDKIHITVQDASHGDGVSDEIPFHPKDDNISHDNGCKLLKEQHVEVETKRVEAFPPSHFGVIKSGVLHSACKEENHSQTVQTPPKRVFIGHSKKKLLVLDVNGLLADVVPSPCRRYKPYKMISKKAVFKRPYCDEFLQFCFEKFNVGVWSSRIKKNLDKMIDFLMGDSRKNLLFCWHASHCSKTGLNTIENKMKPLVLKELKKLWEKFEPNLPWERGEYNETNTLLLDDSPYKALCNPAHTAIFPYPYDYRNTKDSSLGPGGDLQVYLEGLANAENVQEYVRQNPFGQRAITERHSSWGFYSKVFCSKPCPPPYDDGGSKVSNNA